MELACDHLQSETKRLTEVYAARVLAMKALAERLSELLRRFDQEEDALAVRLQQTLAKRGSVRKVDFQRLFDRVRDGLREERVMVTAELTRYWEAEAEFAQGLWAAASGSHPTGFQQFRSASDRFLDGQQALAQQIVGLLRKVQENHWELVAELRSLIDRGDSLRTKHLKTAVRQLLGRREESARETRGLVERFERHARRESRELQVLLKRLETLASCGSRAGAVASAN